MMIAGFDRPNRHDEVRGDATGYDTVEAVARVRCRPYDIQDR